MSHGIKDTIGFNAGLYGLASGAQVLAYFDQVMQQRFLTSGRVRWFAMLEYAIARGALCRSESDANASRRIVHGGALCQPDHAMLGRVIGSRPA